MIWSIRHHDEVTYHMTQVITGHGCFGAYLRRFHLQESEAYAQCETTTDDAEYAFLKCDAWENWRRQACKETGIEDLTPDKMMTTMLASLSNWSTIASLVKRVMHTREDEERRRQREPDRIG